MRDWLARYRKRRHCRRHGHAPFTIAVVPARRTEGENPWAVAAGAPTREMTLCGCARCGALWLQFDAYTCEVQMLFHTATL